MSGSDAECVGVRHLRVLADRPRPAGSSAERDARAYAAGVLAILGYDVREERFAYSAFPGRYATPIAGGILGATIGVASCLGLSGNANGAAAVLVSGIAVTALFARWMLASGVLSAPWLRREGVNLVATRGPTEPRVWLVAHLDSKSQPVPSALRVAGVGLLALALVLSTIAVVMTLAGLPVQTIWWLALAGGVAGALPVTASLVGARSNGAVDNASGVAAVLAAAAAVSRGSACGVLLPSAEELGLAGARAWVRSHPAGIALNCDGVDDGGTLVIMYNRPRPAGVITAIQGVAESARIGRVRARQMPLGLLTDSTAFAAAGWQTVTVSHGSLATLLRVHTSRDSLENLQGSSIDAVAGVLARSVELLAT